MDGDEGEEEGAEEVGGSGWVSEIFGETFCTTGESGVVGAENVNDTREATSEEAAGVTGPFPDASGILGSVETLGRRADSGVEGRSGDGCGVAELSAVSRFGVRSRTGTDRCTCGTGTGVELDNRNGTAGRAAERSGIRSRGALAADSCVAKKLDDPIDSECSRASGPTAEKASRGLEGCKETSP